MPFQALGLSEPITRALSAAQYVTPTPIQAAAIPVVLQGRDLIGIAQTGTGKTAAFALPILNLMAATPKAPTPKRCRVLVLSPTRELSSQITESFITYGRNMRLNAKLAIGGVPIGKQIRGLASGVDVLVATPGRLLDLCKSRAVHLDEVEYLVLDEADRMLDMGFIHDIRRVLAMLPKERQTLFFSATMPPEIARLAGEMLTDPAKVSVAPPASTAERIDQKVYFVRPGDKPALLAKLLTEEGIDRALVFTRTKHGADRVVRVLGKSGVNADAIHGNKSQGQRERALAAFRNGRIKVLIATDIAARGIDVAGISHVINYDVPNIAETYVHRIGRTARAGREGVAISLCGPEETAFLRGIEKLTRLSIPVAGDNPGTGWDPIKATKPSRPARSRPRRRSGGKPRGQSQAAPATPHRGDNIGAVGFLREPRRPAAEQSS